MEIIGQGDRRGVELDAELAPGVIGGEHSVVRLEVTGHRPTDEREGPVPQGDWVEDFVGSDHGAEAGLGEGSAAEAQGRAEVRTDDGSSRLVDSFETLVGPVVAKSVVAGDGGAGDAVVGGLAGHTAHAVRVADGVAGAGALGAVLLVDEGAAALVELDGVELSLPQAGMDAGVHALEARRALRF
jgi:hypothetical protein